MLIQAVECYCACVAAVGLQVSELEAVFQLLRCEVERLFLQAPSVDLDALGLVLNEAEGLIDEQGSIVQVGACGLTYWPCVAQLSLPSLLFLTLQTPRGLLGDACVGSSAMVHACR